jgi:hypothetical protein
LPAKLRSYFFAIKFAPSQECFSSHDRRDLRQQLATELLWLGSESSLLIVAELEAPIADLVSENPYSLPSGMQ